MYGGYTGETPLRTLYGLNGQLELYTDRLVIKHTPILTPGDIHKATRKVDVVPLDSIEDIEGCIEDARLPQYCRLAVRVTRTHVVFLAYSREYCELAQEIRALVVAALKSEARKIIPASDGV